MDKEPVSDRVEGEQRQLRVQIDEAKLQTTYANAFRTNATAEEVILDFGLNVMNPTQQENQPNMIFQLSQRVILNYYSAKRLALALGQAIRRHEDQFGEIELDVNKRQKRK